MFLPTGTIVTVKDGWHGYLDIYIQASPMDFERTEGLCGTFDLDVSNDLRKLDGTLDFAASDRPDFFIDSWRWVCLELCDLGI